MKTTNIKNYFNNEKENLFNTWQETITEQETIKQTTLLVASKYITMNLKDIYKCKILKI